MDSIVVGFGEIRFVWFRGLCRLEGIGELGICEGDRMTGSDVWLVISVVNKGRLPVEEK